MSLSKQVRDYIDTYNHVSFAELQKQFPDHFKGKYSFVFPGIPNVILWSGMTEEFVGVLGSILKEGYQLKPTDLIIYAVDGMMCSFPVWNGTNKKLKSPHWLPVVFVSPHPRKSTKKELAEITRGK